MTPKGKGKAYEDEDDVFTMDDVLGYKKQRGKEMFLVKWKGYSSDEATWEPEENIFDPSDDIIKKMEELKNVDQNKVSPSNKKQAAVRLSAKRDELPAPPAKKARGAQPKNDNESAVKSEEAQPSSLKCKVTRLSIKNVNGMEELTAILEFEDGKTKTVNVATARQEYTQELMDFLLSRVRFRNPAS